MNYSTNYSMREPGRGEEIKVADINYNTEIIDGAMADNRQISLKMYDSTQTYNTGNIRGHENASGHIKAYVCLEDNVTGEWDATKWTLTDLAEQIEEAKQSGGATELDELDDVEITSPTAGQVVTYDGTDWVNADPQGGEVTKTATGNPIELTDGADAPLVKCETEITGSQDLHGYDKPWVGGAGKNKLDLVSITPTKQEQGITFTVNSDGTILANGTATGQCQIVFNISQSTAQTFANLLFTRGSNVPVGLTYAFELGGSPYTQYLMSDGTISSSIASASTSVNFIIRMQAGTTLTNVLFEPMLRASGTTADFEPYSNICPITAYTEGEVEVRGKNLALISDDTKMNSQNATITYQNGGVYLVATGTFSRSGYLFKTKIGENYTISFYASGTGYNQIYVGDEQAWTTGYGRVEITSTRTKYTKTITATSNVLFIGFYNSATETTGTMTVEDFQVESGSSPTTYEHYTSTTHNTTYPSAIFRGSEDCVKGSVTGNWLKAVFDGSEDWDYSSSWSNEQTNVFYCTTGITDAKYISWDEIYGISNLFEWVTRNQLASATVPCIGYSGSYGYAPYITVRVSKTITDVTSFKSFLNDNNLQIAYTLATPTTTPVTPTNLPIKSLNGYNHIESTTGEMEIEYITQAQQPLIDLIRSENGDTYSTSEQIVGKWIDGRPLYSKTYTIDSTSPANPYTLTIDMTGKTLVGYEPHFIEYTVDGSTWYTAAGSELYEGNVSLASLKYYDETPPDLIYSSSIGNAVTEHKHCFTVKYVKTVSNNRSLAKSAPQEEIKEEQVEEVKEEPEEKVEEEKEENENQSESSTR